jgi:plastocyanin
MPPGATKAAIASGEVHDLRRRRVALLLALAAVGVTSVPAAGAATYVVQAGETGRKGVPELRTQNRFMPNVVQVHVGDKVTFMNGVAAPHTATFLGGRPYDSKFFVQPDPAGSVVENLIDADGTPFWFNGLPRFIFDVSAAAPAGGKAVNSRTKYVSTGFLPQGPKAKGVTLTFPKAGSYTYVCLLHAGMVGKINVKPKAAKVPTVAAVARAARKAEADGWAKAKAVLKAPAPANTIISGTAVRLGGGDVNDFAIKPAKLTVPVGTTVTVRTDSNTEPHTLGFGPKEFIEPLVKANNLFPEGPGSPNNVPAYDVYGSENPATLVGGVYTWDGTGFLALPATDASPLTKQLVRSHKLTFTAPGTYEALCLLHYPDMKATITVTP